MITVLWYVQSGVNATTLSDEDYRRLRQAILAYLNRRRPRTTTTTEDEATTAVRTTTPATTTAETTTTTTVQVTAFCGDVGGKEKAGKGRKGRQREYFSFFWQCSSKCSAKRYELYEVGTLCCF